jgi:hypothetical protein
MCSASLYVFTLGFACAQCHLSSFEDRNGFRDSMPVAFELSDQLPLLRKIPLALLDTHVTALELIQ